MDIDRLFTHEAFQVLDEGQKTAYKQLDQDLQGKNTTEAMGIILQFQKSMPQGRKLTPEENQAMLVCIMESMPESDRKKFTDVYNFVSKMKG